MPMFLSLRHSKTISCFLSSIFSVTEVPPLKRFSSLWIAISLLSILTHQNTKSTTGLCIYNTLEERLKTPLKISLIYVDSAYHQEAKAIKFIHFLINCGETSQGLPNRALNPLTKVTFRGRPRDVPKKRPDVLRMSPYGPLCNVKGRICSRTSLDKRLYNIKFTYSKRQFTHNP